jgi:large subunit ribosomal protein L17
MRHLKRTAKLGRKGEHRNAMLANLVCSLIKTKRIRTTLAKARAARPVAEKLVTLGKKGTIHHRRLAAARLKQQARTHFKGSPTRSGKEQREQWRENEDVVRILFDEIAPEFKERPGGYTRIIKLHRRRGDAAEMAFLEWVWDNANDTAPRGSKPKKAKKNPEAKQEEAVVEESAAAEEAASEEPAATEEPAVAEEAPVAEAADEPKAEADDEKK